ncbi:6851_t:CDS:2 [Funneliformis geosporum]|uniref:6851_t:CDS:1 n=1 Tax=Funneliformis geosporum TaxID=1117311 RepID=A0A9W4WS89_9GLOM|nr:6851_t:CDS:2 [Funneliformis geosporum]
MMHTLNPATQSSMFTLVFILIYAASAIFTFQQQSVLHGIVLCTWNIFPIILNYFWIKLLPECQITTCSSHEDSIIYKVKMEGFCLLFEAILFEIISIILTYLLWRNKTWIVLKDFTITRHKHIKRMYKTYHIQTALIHAQIILTLILAYTVWMMELLATHIKIIMFGADIKELWANPFLLYFIFQFYILLVFKAIRSESHLLMGFIYLGNIGEWLEVFLHIYHWCPIDLMNDIRYQDPPEFEYSDDIPSYIARSNEKAIDLA